MVGWPWRWPSSRSPRWASPSTSPYQRRPAPGPHRRARATATGLHGHPALCQRRPVPPSTWPRPPTSVDGQYVYVKATNFPTRRHHADGLCAPPSPRPTDPSCLNGNGSPNYWAPAQVPIMVEARPRTTCTEVPVRSSSTRAARATIRCPPTTSSMRTARWPGFYCDNAADPCAIEVTEETGTGVSATGPRTRRPTPWSSPSPSPPRTPGARIGTRLSDRELVQPRALPPGRGGRHLPGSDGWWPSTPPPTTRRCRPTSPPVGAEIVFIDNPADPAQEANLSAGSSTPTFRWPCRPPSVGMLAGESDGGTAYPVSQYELTPNMVAGLITSEYETPRRSPHATARADRRLVAGVGQPDPSAQLRQPARLPGGRKKD